ncbi:MAG: class I SAM-dependent methyltransferase [Deltaproteobacteria bacterium]|nr:class I SAM-dependent methyltransferase [Deltaproteobacteria bacterium]
MELNPVERWFVNSPVRRSLRARSVRRLVAPLRDISPDGRALEIGCGEGAAIGPILKAVRPSVLDAFDLDERQLERARRKFDAEGGRVVLGTGSAAAIPAPPGTYDTVFQFQVFHHIPNWRTALAEVSRVLRPGGYFIFTDTPIEFFSRLPLGPVLRAVTDHPYDMMFSEDEFRDTLRAVKLETVHWRRLRSGSFEGVARRAGRQAAGREDAA